jgi:hypothetical protein
MDSPKEFSFWGLDVQQMCSNISLSLTPIIHVSRVSRKMHFNKD